MNLALCPFPPPYPVSILRTIEPHDRSLPRVARPGLIPSQFTDELLNAIFTNGPKLAPGELEGGIEGLHGMHES